MRSTVQKAADDVDAAQNFFGEEKKQEAPKPKAEDSGKIAALERKNKQLEERLEITKN